MLLDHASAAREIHLGESQGRGLTHPMLHQAPQSMTADPVRGATYELVLRGELDRRFAYLFDGMEMRCIEGTTILSGAVRDQAALHGLIESVEELGLELLSVQQVATSSPSEPGRDDERPPTANTTKGSHDV